MVASLFNPILSANVHQRNAFIAIGWLAQNRYPSWSITLCATISN